MPPTPVQRSKAMAACAISISEPFAARRPRARAAREQRGLGWDVDEVEHRGAIGQVGDRDRDAGVDHADGRRVHGEVGGPKRVAESRIVQRNARRGTRPDAGEALGEGRRRRGRAISDRHRARPGVEAGMDHRVRRATRAGNHHPRAGQGPAHGELDAGTEPRRIGVDADQPPVGGAHHVVHRADRGGIRLDLVAQVRDDSLVRRGHAQPQPVRTACRGDGRLDLVGVELEQDVASVDAGRVERRVVHHLRVSPSQRLPEQRDPARHRRAGDIRRTGPAVAGNVTFGMISSIQSWSWAGSGVMVWSTKYSTPASTRAWSEAITSSGVPNR